MSIGLREEHEELRSAVRRWAERHCPGDVVRAGLEGDVRQLPPFWSDLAAQGWLGLHVSEDLGGHGFGLLELAVVIEELGWAIAPGPFLPTVLAAALVARGEESLAKTVVPRLVEGELIGAVALGTEPLSGIGAADGSLRLSGTVPAILGAPLAGLFVVPVSVESGRTAIWCVIESRRPDGEADPAVSVGERNSLDLTRASASLDLDDFCLRPDRVLSGVTDGDVRSLGLLLASAELTGSARRCLEAATEHARTRVQFSRPIGQFQGVKHKLANLLCLVEQMTAATWDAALAFDHPDPAQRVLATATAGALTLEGGVRAAKDAIQVLGGMGFTWEHDAHLHLRRAGTLRQVLGGPAQQRMAVSALALAGTRRFLGVELPPEADSLRRELEPLVAEVAAAPAEEHRRLLGEAGLLFPHWPSPYGRDAGAVEQLVIDELLAEAGLRRPPAHVAAWALPTIIAHGTDEQKERWVLPTLRGELLWCQLFSEPGAGSDLAALATKATPGEGGFVVSGQKVWTSVAARANVGILLARTDPDAAKHEGITYFVLDMKSEGIDVRPLREITGDALFNEVFLNDVFVPDDCVIGAVNGGWRLARTTLANERVSLASTSAFGGNLEAILKMVAEGEAEPAVLDDLARLLVDAQSLAMLGQRSTLRSLGGLEPGPEASVRKLLSAELDQRISDFGLSLLGTRGVYVDGDSAWWAREFLHTLCLTIAGGTSEVQRNVIGERLLGLPRDPEPTGALR